MELFVTVYIDSLPNIAVDWNSRQPLLTPGPPIKHFPKIEGNSNARVCTCNLKLNGLLMPLFDSICMFSYMPSLGSRTGPFDSPDLVPRSSEAWLQSHWFYIQIFSRPLKFQVNEKGSTGANETGQILGGHQILEPQDIQRFIILSCSPFKLPYLILGYLRFETNSYIPHRFSRISRDHRFGDDLQAHNFPRSGSQRQQRDFTNQNLNLTNTTLWFKRIEHDLTTPKQEFQMDLSADGVPPKLWQF